jgi:hypothetical protein
MNAMTPHRAVDGGRRPGRPLPTVGRGGVVPYIATWSEEPKPPVRIVEHRWGGIGFADETWLIAIVMAFCGPAQPPNPATVGPSSR